LRVHVESPGFIIDRARFDRDYARRASAAGAFLLCAARLTGMDGETLLVRRGADLLRFSAKLTIAADGAVSTVGRLLGFARPNTLIGAQREIPLKKPLSHTTVVMTPWIFQGYGWLFPKGRVANVGVGVAAGSGVRPNDVLDRLVGLFRDDGLLGPGELARYRGLIPVSGMRSTTVVGNTLFCGDAAGLTHPVTGAGVPQAVVSGRLAGLAAAALIRDGRKEALVEYDRELRVRFAGPLEHAASKRGVMEARWGGGDFTDLCRETWIGFKGYRVRVRG
jgi:flavin-dependent dehydrogenase